jgi:pSer/pThr/pTyr-binding forkhead associated (FHA) protein
VDKTGAMGRLVIKLDQTVLREVSLGDGTVTIGRLPDNDVHLDDLAVSGHHAKVVHEGGHYVLYDEDSTNGSYVNGEKVERKVLATGDAVLIGPNLLVVQAEPGKAASSPDDTAPLGAILNPPSARTASRSDGGRLGTITVVEGKTDQHEYVLSEHETVIGKSETAHIRLTRWFAPKVAATIYHREGRYFLRESQSPTPVRVNSEVVQGERQLEPGDTLLIDDITLQFNLQS